MTLFHLWIVIKVPQSHFSLFFYIIKGVYWNFLLYFHFRLIVIMFQAFSAYSETDISAKTSPWRVLLKDLAFPWKIYLLMFFFSACGSQQLCYSWIVTVLSVACFCGSVDSLNYLGHCSWSWRPGIAKSRRRSILWVWITIRNSCISPAHSYTRRNAIQDWT